MMSAWRAMPERSSMVDPAAIGEFTHSSRWIWWPAFRKVPKNGSPRRRSMISWSAPPVWPMRIPDHEAGPAVQRAPDAEGDGEGVASLDPPVARAEQPERCPGPARQHQVAGERHAVPVEQPHRLALPHPPP